MNELIEITNTFLKTPLANTLFNWKKKGLTYGSFLLPFFFLVTGEYKFFGTMAFYLLILIMLIRPMADIFPKILLFKKIIVIRRAIGIFLGMSALTHGFGYIYQNPDTLYQAYFYATDGYFLYGGIALVFGILLLITSNNFSVRLLGKNWKWLQRGVHIMFYLVCLHLAIIGEHGRFDILPILLGIGVFGVRFYAWYKKRKPNF